MEKMPFSDVAIGDVFVTEHYPHGPVKCRKIKAQGRATAIILSPDHLQYVRVYIRKEKIVYRKGE